jgi:hypothetical protein
MAYNITPFQLLPSQQDQRPSVGYENGVGNPNDYEYYVDPQTRTVKRRAKQGLQARAEAAAPVSGGLNTSGGFGGSSNDWASKTPAEQAAFYADNPRFAAITQGLQSAFGLTSLGKLAQTFNPIGFGEQSMIARGVDPAYMGQINAQAQANAAQPGFSPAWGGGLLDTQGDQSGDYDGQASEGFNTSLGGYTGQSSYNSNEGTSGSPNYGGGGFL